MRKVSLQELYKIGVASKSSIYENAYSVRRVPQLFLHWSAGHYGQPSERYHINIDYDGSVYLTVDDLSSILQHTWKQNTGNIGITMLCCAFATSNNLGNSPPTHEQIEAMAQVIAVLTLALGLPCDYNYVRTHAEQADIDGYGPSTTCERWDLAILSNGDEWMSGGNILRGKAIWYQQEMQK